ncbi:MAG: hypothetical protein LBD77_00005 [Bifidobacteriaceae bacterium]|nr:hypothetical protein [Bifidobacteriaceae bacterium]
MASIVEATPGTGEVTIDPGDAFGESPDFSGPWADDFRQFYLGADETGRRILSDGVITEQEYLDIVARIDECFEARGYLVERGVDGRMSVEDTRKRGENAPIAEDARTCQGIGGGIDQLYLDMRRNPDNSDMDELMAACLARGGLVDASFTKNDYIAAMEGADLPWSGDDPVFQACLADPLGLVPDQ